VTERNALTLLKSHKRNGCINTRQRQWRINWRNSATKSGGDMFSGKLQVAFLGRGAASPLPIS